MSFLDRFIGSSDSSVQARIIENYVPSDSIFYESDVNSYVLGRQLMPDDVVRDLTGQLAQRKTSINQFMTICLLSPIGSGDSREDIVRFLRWSANKVATHVDKVASNIDMYDGIDPIVLTDLLSSLDKVRTVAGDIHYDVVVENFSVSSVLMMFNLVFFPVFDTINGAPAVNDVDVNTVLRFVSSNINEQFDYYWQSLVTAVQNDKQE